MHFSKTYAQLLLSLPLELRENAIQYRQLKKLINQIVRELSSLGLKPSVLQELLEESDGEEEIPEESVLGKERDKGKGKERAVIKDHIATLARRQNYPKIVYEVDGALGRIEPRLRLRVNTIPGPLDKRISKVHDESGNSTESERDTEVEGAEILDGATRAGGEKTPHISLLWALQRKSSQIMFPVEEESEEADVPLAQALFEQLDSNPGSGSGSGHSTSSDEVVIPLVSDKAFFRMLFTALESLSAHLSTIQSDFVGTLSDLSRTIGDLARPTSATSSTFHPHSVITSNAGTIRVMTSMNKSDLYFWREIFQLYVEAEVFESVSEINRGERSVEESEHRLKLFAERVTKRGLGDGRKLKLKQSRAALETFLELNLFILNIKKFQFANAEATRKILKKHTKRTALPPIQSGDGQTQTLLLLASSTSLPRILVQAIGETLLPIIPHPDDYACLICTSIAFKPIRLNCGHLFCVRCLVKMQKRGNGDCPMCRAPSVLVADRSNVDWALLNFMQDWFPIESREKLKINEKEATEEELVELGLDPNEKCVVM